MPRDSLLLLSCIRQRFASWSVELVFGFTKTLRGEFGFKETADARVHFRTEKDKSITLVLVYVDDLLVCSETLPLPCRCIVLLRRSIR